MADKKQCTQCRTVKPVSAFSPCRNTLQPACKECRNKKSASIQHQVSVASKRCGQCGETKQAQEFWRHRKSKDGLQKECKSCTTKRKAAVRYAVTLAEKRCKDCGQTKPAGSFPLDPKRLGGLRSECRECASVRNRASIYKIPLEVARGIVASKACEICSRSFYSQSDVHIDHCHRTGAVRGALCEGCNKMIGCARDNAQTLEMAAGYLKKHTLGSMSDVG